MCRIQSYLLTILKCGAMIIQPSASKHCIAAVNHSRATPPSLEKLAGNTKFEARQQDLRADERKPIVESLTQFCVKLVQQE
jgi:hypothetical protein